MIQTTIVKADTDTWNRVAVFDGTHWYAFIPEYSNPINVTSRILGIKGDWEGCYVVSREDARLLTEAIKCKSFPIDIGIEWSDVSDEYE